jgi:chemotaxis protein methyltransferase CheR
MTAVEKIDLEKREFCMTDDNFHVIAALSLKYTGIVLSDHKKQMVYSRLARRIRALKLHTFEEYCELINQPKSQELSDFINAITTNLTSFFRENHHFEYLENTVFKDLKLKNKDSKKVRIWSAGCSTGEEPYSLAMTVARSFPSGWDVRILATDLDSEVLNKAKQGLYNVDRVEGLDSAISKRWFLKSRDQSNTDVQVKKELQEYITFNRLNLLESPWPMKQKFDVIFCRNVVIYFNKDTQKTLFGRYADQLKDDGHLFIGHSESLHNVSDRFKSLGQTIYQKSNKA